jgi:DNA polymerase elongation subunit (family B)
MEKHNIFSYYWHVDDKEKEVTSIRVYGLDEENKNICLRIDNFTPYIYIELPASIVWSESNSRRLGAKIDDMMRNQKPLQKCLVMKHKLYGVEFERDGSRKKYPYMFCSFSSKEDIKTLTYKLNKPIAISGLSNNLRLKVHEQDADPILQLVSLNKVPTAGWITFIGKPVAKAEQVTLCDAEYKVKYNNLKKLERNSIANPKIMGFDIEVNSSNPSAMPKAEKMYDKVFQISCVFMREGDDENIVPYLLTLGDPLQDVVGDNVIIQRYDTEYEILEGFSELIRTENPNVIVGYNILSFDIPYMIARSKVPCLCSNFDKQGFHKDNRSKEKTIKWSSSAFKNQEFQFLDAEGRLFVDLLPLIQREYKMDNYRLKTVSDFFLGETKDPLSVKGIFKCYRVGTKRESDGSYSKRAQKAMGLVGKYCVQDSVLVVKLMSKLKTWVGLHLSSQT